jgi:hypothetical protein
LERKPLPKINPHFEPLPKVPGGTADLAFMVNPVSSANQIHPNSAAKPAASPKPQPTQQKSAPQPSDTVTLKSTGAGGHDGSTK